MKKEKCVCQPVFRTIFDAIFVPILFSFVWIVSKSLQLFQQCLFLVRTFFRFNDRRVSMEKSKQKTRILTYKRLDTFYTYQIEEEENDIMRRVSYKLFQFVCAKKFNFYCLFFSCSFQFHFCWLTPYICDKKNEKWRFSIYCLYILGPLWPIEKQNACCFFFIVFFAFV